MDEKAKKRSFLTTFAILGILIVAAIIIIVVFGILLKRTSGKKQINELQEELTEIFDEVEPLLDRPKSFLITNYYLPFAYFMPTEFSKSDVLEL